MRAFTLFLAFLAPSGALAQISPPDLLRPEDGGWRWVDDVHEWTEVPGAIQYRAQIDTLGGGFSSPVADTVITGTFWGNRISMGFYEWRVAAYDGSAWGDWSDVWTFESRFPVSNEPDAVEQGPLVLERVSPNPSRGAVHLRFGVLDGGEADLRVYDAVGREVATVYRGASVGVREAHWDGSSLPAGTYFLVLRSEAGSVVERIVLVE